MLFVWISLYENQVLTRNCFEKCDAFSYILDQKDEDVQYEEETVKLNMEPEYKHLIAIKAKKLKGGVKDWLHDDPSAAKRISLRETRLEKAIENHAIDVVR